MRQVPGELYENMDFWQRKWFLNCGINFLVLHLTQKIHICDPTKKYFYTLLPSKYFPRNHYLNQPFASTEMLYKTVKAPRRKPFWYLVFSPI